MAFYGLALMNDHNMQYIEHLVVCLISSRSPKQCADTKLHILMLCRSVWMHFNHGHDVLTVCFRRVYTELCRGFVFCKRCRKDNILYYHFEYHAVRMIV